MTIYAFLSDRLGRLVLQGILGATAAVFLLTTGTQTGVIVILLIVWLLVLVCVQCVDYIKTDRRLKELQAIMEHLDRKYLFMECIPKAQTAYERKLLELLRKAGKSMIETVSDAQAAQREYRDYVESWVHEIKTPITAAGLICRSAEPSLRQRLSQELAQIEAHVERALFYARAESPEKDFIIRQTSLEDIAATAISRHQTLLIQSGIRMETDDLAYTVYTDSKWAVFILGQLLQNAARYRGNEPVVTLSARLLGQQVQLKIQDNGMGIPAHELPRIFDRGFTGSNGRSRGGSTGMGLYLCRRLAGYLEMDLQITSTADEGTMAVLTFPAKKN